MSKPAKQSALTELQKLTAQSIVNIFETGRSLGDYGKVTLLPGDPGHLTYGRSQTTLASGNLHLLIRAYCDAPDAIHADQLRPYLERLAARDLSLDTDLALKRLLRESGDDLVMHTTQDAFFDRVYWMPAQSTAAAVRLSTALGAAVVYDSTVHGSWGTVRDLTARAHGNVDQIGENAWIQRYVETRRSWLANHPKSILHATVYRMNSFAGLISEEKWNLELPIVVRGIRIDEDTFAPPVRASAADETDRVLKLESPFMVGDDVRAIQQALQDKGLPGNIDGIYGPLTEARVRQFQLQSGLRADGIAGPATKAALGL